MAWSHQTTHSSVVVVVDVCAQSDIITDTQPCCLLAYWPIVAARSAPTTTTAIDEIIILLFFPSTQLVLQAHKYLARISTNKCLFPTICWLSCRACCPLLLLLLRFQSIRTELLKCHWSKSTSLTTRAGNASNLTFSLSLSLSLEGKWSHNTHIQCVIGRKRQFGVLRTELATNSSFWWSLGSCWHTPCRHTHTHTHFQSISRESFLCVWSFIILIFIIIIRSSIIWTSSCGGGRPPRWSTERKMREKKR